MEATAIINTEILSCVNCLEFPVKEVYHCTDGHLICDCCITCLIKCTQCQAWLGPAHKRQRNFLAESVLDGVLLPCKYDGCMLKMDRTKLATHRIFCPFRPVKLCSTFGLPDCQTVVQTGEQLRTHLLEKHQRVKTLNTNRMCWPALPRKYMKVYRPWNYFWSAIEGEDPMFMTHSKMSINDKGEVSFCAVIIYLGESPQVADSYLATLKLSMIYEGQKKYACSWTGPPVHFKMADDPIALPYYSMPIKYFMNKMDSIEKEFTLILDFAAELPAQNYPDVVNGQFT